MNKLINLQPRISRHDGTFALILVPTRELCLQIYKILLNFSKKFYYIIPGYVMGGENKNKEKARLRKGVNVLVASPGRLLDHLKNTKSFELKYLKFLVFDEADRLLDLGFEKDIFEILELLESKNSAPHGGNDEKYESWDLGKRQNILVSATLNSRVEKLGSKSLHSPIIVHMDKTNVSETDVGLGKLASEYVKSDLNVDTEKGNDGDNKGMNDAENEIEAKDGIGVEENKMLSIPNTIHQFYLKVSCRMRLVSLFAFIKTKVNRKKPAKILAFVSTCDAVEFLHQILSEFSIIENGVSRNEQKSSNPNSESDKFLDCSMFKLHGNMKQKERAESFLGFGKASNGVLIATDVASRGLDFPSIDCIIQYDPPGEAEEYVHRVGRTARLGKEGESIIFLQPSEEDYLNELGSHGVFPQETKLISILNAIPIHKKGSKKGPTNSTELPENHFGAAALQARLETLVASRPDLHVLATDGFRSFVRGYGAYKGALKKIFHPQRLHLGHVAKSFALKNAPSVLGQSSAKLEIERKKKTEKKILKKKKNRPRPAKELE